MIGRLVKAIVRAFAFLQTPLISKVFTLNVPDLFGYGLLLPASISDRHKTIKKLAVAAVIK